MTAPEELVAGYFLGALSAPELETLAAAIRSDPELARNFAESARDELLLFQVHQPAARAIERRPATPARRARARHPFRLLLVAAACLALGLAGYLWLGGGPKAVGALEEVAGQVFRVVAEAPAPAARGETLHEGDGLKTSGLGSRAAFRFLDGSRLDLGADTLLGRIEDGPQGKRVSVLRGGLSARIPRQPGDRPAVFATPHGEARVLGTTLRIAVDPDPKKGTRLEVEEGKVRLRNLAGKTIEVSSGHYAVAARGTELAAKSLAAPAPRGAELVAKMPPNSWLSVPGTHLRSVLPDPARFPKIAGRSGPRSVVDAWSGGALDTRRNRLVVWGGGFTNYHGNEIYAFDLGTLAWERLTDPTPDPADGRQVNADGTPNGRATYNGLAYVAHADRFWAFGGDIACTEPPKREPASILWTFDFATKKWASRNPSGERPPSFVLNLCSYDPATRKVWWAEVNSSAPGLYSYDYDTNAWTRHNADLFGRFTSAVDTRRGLLVMAGEGRVVTYDLRQAKVARETWKTAGGDPFVARSSPGLDYDPAADRIVGWAGGAVWALDPQTRTWTAHDAPGAPAASPNGIYGRWRYVPLFDAFVVVTSTDENVHFYRLPK